MLNLVLVPLGILAIHLGLAHVNPKVFSSPLLGFFAIAMVGNALAPWMPFFQAEAVRARGLSPQDLAAARTDIALGGVVQAAVAAAVLLVAALVRTGGSGAGVLLTELGAHTSPVVPALLAIGLVDAGLVAALTVSLTTAWTIAETWAGPRKDRLRDPLVRRIYLICLVTAAAVAWIPAAPSDAVRCGGAGSVRPLMPPLLLALLQLANLPLMGALRNGRTANALMGLAIVVFTGAAVALFVYA